MVFALHNSRSAQRYFIVPALALLFLATAAHGQQPETQNKAERRFDIWEYQVEGNTLLGTEQIERAVYHYLGPGRSLADIDAAADNLERAYRDSGYPTIFVSVPEQNVVGGAVRLAVVEGRIDRVRVQGTRYFTISGIRAGLPSLKRGAVLHVPTMQKELNALNASSGDLKVTPVLKPGRAPGTVDVDLKVRDESPLHGGMELNNYKSANTTDLRLGASLSYDNLWQRKHSLSLQYQTSPQDTSEVRVLAATYVMPWMDTGNRLAFYAIDSNSNVASVGDINIIGKGTIYGGRFVMPLPSSRKFIHSLTLGVDYKDYQEIIRLDADNSIETPINYAVWLLQYNATAFTPKSRTQWNVSANFGIRGIGNSDNEFIDKRNRSYADFSYLRAGVTRSDFLPGDWILVSALRGQITDMPLINNEQFSAGGNNSVRGYYESQALGDSGVSGGLTFKTPHFFKKVEAIDELRLLAFIEGARLHIRDALPDQENSIGLASTGLGLELQAWRDLNLSLDWAYILKAAGDLDRGDNNVHMGLQWHF